MAATHSYKAVPSIFTVAPKGSTKLAVLCDTPARFFTHSIVRGRVADDEAVENAINMAGDITDNCFSGLTPPTNLSKSGNATNACSANAVITVNRKTNMGAKASKPVALTVLAINAKIPIGANLRTN